MAKVFRIHKGNKSATGWFPSDLTGDLIETISSEDHKGTKVTTAVPTPFARMDLVRTAFKKVEISGNLAGDSDEHQLISNALDVGEILFNYELHRDQLDIIPWRYTEGDEWEGVFKDESQQHNGFGDTLRLFLEQDSDQYNFNLADTLYILVYDAKVIGATSPRTLFYASVRANEFDIPISFGREENVFGKVAYPLYARNENYIKYLFALSKQQGFSRMFPEFYNYLDRTKRWLESENPVLGKKLREINEEYLEQLRELTVPMQENVCVEPVRGLSLRITNGEGPKTSRSDFLLEPAERKSFQDEKLPLVMPQGNFQKNWLYVNTVWNNKINVPEKDERPIAERTLPTIGLPYPYVIAPDFFATKIMRLPYPIDASKYVTISTEDKLKHYLLPLTPLFFQYYTLSDIEDRLEMNELAGGAVKVSLTVSTKKGDLKYTQIYSVANEKNSEYVIEELDCVLGLVPFAKPKSNEEEIEYTIVAGFPRLQRNRKIEVKVYHSISNERYEISGKERSKSETANYTKFFPFKEHFDFIEIKARETSNLLIPKLEVVPGNRTFSFGIDFGTTNTHLAYKVDGEDENFKVFEGNPLITFLKEPLEKIETKDRLVQIEEALEALIQETLPRGMNQNKSYPFPFQTCLLENHDNPANDGSALFIDANIGFDYGVKKIKAHLNPIPELKWANLGATDDARRGRSHVRLYIRELLLLCKWTVLKNGGKLSATHIYWTYPTSMQPGRVNQFERIWSSEFKALFPKEASVDQLIQVPESTAPFHYAAKRLGMNVYNEPTITIDVGGGTTDVAIFDKGEPRLITSFKFGGNSIFGDGYNRKKEMNGFVKVFEPIILDAIKRQNLENKNVAIEVAAIMEQLVSQDSVAIMNYIFSLENREDVKGANITEELMQYDAFKIIFLLFYGAIIFHIAQIFKSNDLRLPRNILFSGTASKSLSIIDASKNYSFVNTYFRAIFTHVLGPEKVNEEVKMEVFPGIQEHKELTAKGMLYDEDPLTTKQIKAIRMVHSGESNPKQTKLIVEDLSTNPLIVEGVEENAKAFLDLFQKLKTDLSIDSEVGMISDNMALLDDLSKDIKGHIISGIKTEYKDSDVKENEISETLFFYALKGLLPELAYAIATKNEVL